MTASDHTDLPTDATTPPSPYVVCLGSSAGGLAAIESFFAHIPTGCGLAFVLVMHLDPRHESIIDELLGRRTSLKIVQATDGMRVCADVIYFIPPNKAMTISGNRLSLGARISLPIDDFLVSLAADRQDTAIAVILSGAGSDGAQGVKAIKEQGGLLLVQDAESAQHGSMPRSAAGIADVVGPPAKLAEYVVKWARGAGRVVGDDESKPAASSAASLQRVLYLLRAQTGHDFTLYKKNTLRRRLERRMVVQNIETLADYLRYLESDAGERERLVKEFLIGVTSFFRDPQAFDALKTDIAPYLLSSVCANNAMRIWSAGCSTGEEAYALGMVITEASRAKAWDFDLKIFASDIDQAAISIAREGRYPDTIADEMSPERLKSFFVADERGFRVRKELKERFIFALHNVASDPPFSKVDMISCRNLMIYLEPVLQQKLLRIFHYALNPGGVLFLGSSETIGDAAGLFMPLDKKWKFFERKSAVVSPSLRNLDFEPRPSIANQPSEPRSPVPTMTKNSIRDLSQEALLAAFAPPSVVCDEAGDILYVHGRTGNYLEAAHGEARMNILAMARDGLKLEIRRGLQRSQADRQSVRYRGLKFALDDKGVTLDLTVRPLPETSKGQRLYLVCFEDAQILPSIGESHPAVAALSPDERTRELERDLLFTKEQAQHLVEQLETSNEELKSMNEELQSSNEELQSSNEELETAKEELQAVNEELITLNAELQGKIEELSTANSDLDNFLSSSSIATIVLNEGFRITRFSRSTTKIFNLIPTDVGRELVDIASQLKYENVITDAHAVLATLESIERVVETKDGRALLMRITPYRTYENVISGVVIGFADISEQQRLAQRAAILAEIIDAAPALVLILDAKKTILRVNERTCATLGRKAEILEGMTLEDVGLVATPPIVGAGPWSGTVAVPVKGGPSVTASAVVTQLRSAANQCWLALTVPH